MPAGRDGAPWEVRVAHKRQSRPDSGLGVQVKDLKTLKTIPSPLGSVWGVHTMAARGMAWGAGCRVV